MKKVAIKYIVKFHDKNGNYELPARMVNITEINPNCPLGCINYGSYCSLFYNNSEFNEKQLLDFGYNIVDSLDEIKVYEQENKIYKWKSQLK